MRFLDRSRRPSLALDVGTAMTRGCSERSEVRETPSVVRDDVAAGEGRGALRGGVVCDVAAAAEVIAPVVRSVATGWRRPTALVCAPTDATPLERDLLVEAVVSAGASVTAIVPEPLAAAVGAGLDISSEYAQFIIDIGEGVTDLAVISSGEIRSSTARRSGCSDIRRSIADWLQWHRGISVTDSAADDLVRAFCASGSAPASFEIEGRSVRGAERAGCRVSRDEVGTIVEPAIESLSDFVLRYFLRLPDRLAVEVIENGALVTGGGAVLDRLVARIESSTGLTIVRAANPYRSVIIGAREMLRNGMWPNAA